MSLSPQPNRPASPLAPWRLAAARAALLAEQIWPRLLPIYLALALLVAAALLGLWAWTPGWLHAAMLALAGLIAAWQLKAIAQDLRWPSRQAVFSRWEQDSGLSHQPLQAVADRQANAGDAFAATLWARHQHQAAAQLASLRLAPPQLNWLARDRYGLRGLAMLLLALGVAVAGPLTGQRLAGALVPDLGGAAAPAALEAWITPPAYTGLAPIMLPQTGSQTPIAVPAGAQVTALLSGGWRTPRLFSAQGALPFAEPSPHQYRLEAPAPVTDHLSVRQGWRQLARWTVDSLPDISPLVSFAGPPRASASGSLAIDYAVLDDYGVTGMTLSVTGPVDMIWPARDLTLALPPTKAGEEVRGTAYRDLAASPWAGVEVTLVLRARDALEQVGESAPVQTLLPERTFSHPVARAIAGIRKRLFQAPADRAPALAALGQLSAAPGDFGHDLTVFLALRDAYWRLTHDLEIDAVPAVNALLWQAALALEDGDQALARSALRAQMDALMEALAQGQDSTAMMDALERQLQDFLRAQAQAALNAPGQDRPSAPDEAMTISADTLAKMLEHMRNQAAAGDMAGAMQTLAALQSIMENMQNAQPPSAEDMARAAAAQQALDALQTARGDQQALNAQTASGGLPQRSLGQAQSGVARQLGAAAQKLEAEAGLPAPDGIGQAQALMDAAATALRQGQKDRAANLQGQAMTALDQAIDSLRQDMAAMMRQMAGATGASDPAGRPLGGTALEDVVIPSDADFARSRAILNEVRRRLADPERSQAERDYLERLLDRF